MLKRIGIAVGCLIVALFLLAVLFRLANDGPVERVSAARLTSSFTTPHNISNSPSGTYENASQHVRGLIASDGYLHPTWMEGELNRANGPAYVRGQDTSWPQWEFAGPSNNKGYTNPAIAMDSNGTLHLVWTGGSNPPYDIFYATKPAGGGWSTYANLSQDSNNSIYPTIAIDSQDQVWVVWETQVTEQDFEIYGRNKPAAGGWGAIANISSRGGQDLEPDIAIDANDIPFVVWRSNATAPNWEILLNRYVGGAWIGVSNLSANSTPSHFPRAAADDQGNVFVVWEDEIDGADRFQTLFRRWDGSQWLSTVRVSATPSKALYPAVGADGCNIYVVWTDYRNTSTETYFSYSTDCGSNWSNDENVSNNNSSSFYPAVVAETGGHAHIFWQDYAPGNFDVYYSEGTVQLPATPTPTPTQGPTNTPTATPTNTPTPTPTSTPDPRPYGWIEPLAHEPHLNSNYTRLLDVGLRLWATGAVSRTVTDMRYDNWGDFHDHPEWEPYSEWVYNWPLLETPYNCEYKWVFAQFRDDLGLESLVFSDYIFYDNYLTATMMLNGGNTHTNRTLVMVNSEDRDLAAGCSGLEDISLWEEGLTRTVWITYYPEIYFFLAETGPATRTVYAQYRDRADNTGIYADSIIFDVNPPYSGTPPTLNGGITLTNQLIISVSNLQAFDDESGVANVWLSNRKTGPWLTMPYYVPPYDYLWNLAYGGPPTQSPDLHRVYVRYEDGAGYGSYPGNLSDIYSSAILVGGISNVYLPLLLDGHLGLTSEPPFAESEAVELTLLAKPLPAGPSEDVLLWLAARREQEQPLQGTLRLSLPAGLEVVRAWSAYGELLQVDDHLVVSQEWTSSRLTPWILVHARVEDAEAILQVQGEMIWPGGSVTAPSVQVGTR